MQTASSSQDAKLLAPATSDQPTPRHLSQEVRQLPADNKQGKSGLRPRLLLVKQRTKKIPQRVQAARQILMSEEGVVTRVAALLCLPPKTPLSRPLSTLLQRRQGDAADGPLARLQFLQLCICCQLKPNQAAMRLRQGGYGGPYPTSHCAAEDARALGSQIQGS